jgi:hypothetical protein
MDAGCNETLEFLRSKNSKLKNGRDATGDHGYPPQADRWSLREAQTPMPKTGRTPVFGTRKG